MSGHSKWHSIKHKKAAIDAKRGAMFTKVIKELTVAARLGGGDPDMNARLRTAVNTAKAANMPNDNIERAIKKGTGELEGVSYEEVTYEGYAPGGVAVIAEVMTDNRNRTAPEMRHLFSKYGGSLGQPNSVGFMFDRKSLVYVPAEGTDEDELMMQALEAGAADVQKDGDYFEITSEPAAHNAVLEKLEQAGFKIESSEVSLIPQTRVKAEGKDLEKAMKMLELLEEHDDVQNVYHNLDVPAEMLEGDEG
jgi:YebC/PmpR family DNA-binding regulatory protein